jgi:hypothetical protein
MITPTIMTTIATTLKYRVFKQKLNICLENYYMCRLTVTQQVPLGEQEIIFPIWNFQWGLGCPIFSFLCSISSPTIMTTIATTLKYRVFKQKLNICLENYYMY